MLTYAMGQAAAEKRYQDAAPDVSWRMLTYADVCYNQAAAEKRYQDAAPDVSWRTLTYADVC